MNPALHDVTARLLDRLSLVRANLGYVPAAGTDPDACFADLVDSMAMVEFLGLVADDCGVTPGVIEECTGRRFGTVAELATALLAAGLLPHSRRDTPAVVVAPRRDTPPPGAACWLAATAVRLPRTVQPAARLDEGLQRPPGWLEEHAGIRQRHVWAEEDPLAAAVEAARECLDRAGVLLEEVRALLVTSEAPPLLAGLAAALHHRLDLRPETAALEVGGACTGFLAALWLGQRLLPACGVVAVIAVEAPSCFLRVEPGPAGEAAALFGDAAAAALLCGHATAAESVALAEVVLGVDGGAGHLLRVERRPAGQVEVAMDGGALASRAVRAMVEGVRGITERHDLAVADLTAVVMHGGNGRMPGLLARQLGLPPERVWSETARTGNLGSASLPAALAARRPPRGPVAWTAAGAGLTWATALTRASVRAPAE
jgi:3-oxoacyl-[acyl-carrier-protein] synthase III